VPADPASTPTGTDPGSAAGSVPSRIVESHAVALAPTSIEDAVAVARLRRSRGRWRLDATFRPSRVKT
jgi:hypothetical protein